MAAAARLLPTRRLCAICPELKNAPRVLCVGDIHTENFGTRRDAQGRLIWGVNREARACGEPHKIEGVAFLTPPTAASADSHCHFRGLLGLHSRYGPPDRSAALGDLCHEAPTRAVTRTSRSSATGSIDNSPGGNLAPLVIRAFGAHCHNRTFWLYSRGVNEAFFAELSAWLAEAGLAGMSETDIVSGFCNRCVAAGLPLARALMFIDTLHPVHEGSLFRWGYGPTESPLLEYGRTSPEALAASGSEPQDVEQAQRWRNSPHYKMVQTGDSFLRRRLNATAKDEFPVLSDFLAAGMTDYVAIINRFAPQGVIGEMDGFYSSWATRVPDGFSDGQIAALQRTAPYLAVAIKSVSLARMTGTLMETYLGRDAGRRVLGGRIVRGIAERIDAVVWFSDLQGFTRITDTAPEQAIPLLNDYSDAIVSAIHEHGGDVLKLIGDGTFAIFTAEDRAHACGAALSAAIAARERVEELNGRRVADGKPITDMYLGLHVGEVFYGNVGSRERLDFTVIGPAVNEASRIAAMCRAVDQPVLMSSAFANVGGIKRRLVSVGRYALRGVAHPQELFTLDPDA
jgi:adenylate cyclase